MKKSILLSIIGLASCKSAIDTQKTTEETYKTYQPSVKIIKLADNLEYGIYKLTVDSSEYIVCRSTESVSIVKHK